MTLTATTMASHDLSRNKILLSWRNVSRRAGLRRSLLFVGASALQLQVDSLALKEG